MLDPVRTSYNLALFSFQRSPYTVIYDPSTLDAVLIVVDSDRLYATKLSDDQDPAAVAEAILRHDGIVSLIDGEDVRSILDRGPFAISSDALNYIAAAPVAENGYTPHIYVGTPDNGVHGFNIATTDADAAENSRIPGDITKLFAYS